MANNTLNTLGKLLRTQGKGWITLPTIPQQDKEAIASIALTLLNKVHEDNTIPNPMSIKDLGTTLCYLGNMLENPRT